MQHKEAKLAKRYDIPGRSRAFTDTVYSGACENRQDKFDLLRMADQQHFPPQPEYRVFFGELHGHSNLSDGHVDIDTYFQTLRDKAGLDFAALTDHDHGGVGYAELWGEKWERIKAEVKRYNDPGKFTTILAYERDSYPWYNNMVVYFDNYDAELLRGEHDGELTREELHTWLARPDLIMVPHDTNTISAGADFLSMEPADMTPLIQVYSRHNCSERYDPQLFSGSDCEGGHWIDALERGAKMGCIASSDDHSGTNGLILTDKSYPHNYPGICCVWAKENTLPAIFEALKARRCYASMGGRITLDFRIDGHYMGEEIEDPGERYVFFRISAEEPVDMVTIVKNGRDYIRLQNMDAYTLIDYRKERSVDYYYIRARLKDGRMVWSSPIWVGTDE